MAEDYGKLTEDLKRVVAEERQLLEVREEKLKKDGQTLEVQKKLVQIEVQKIENQIQDLKLAAKTAESDAERIQ